MPKGDKSAYTARQQPQGGGIEKGDKPKGAARPQAEARGWASANKLHDPGRKSSSRRKVPYGPVGGSGRKTNLSRSS